MKLLFRTIEEVRKFITVDISSNFKTIEPYIYQAKKYIVDVLGEELYSKLIDYLHNTDSTKENKYEDLLDKVRYPLSNYAYYLAISKLNVKVGENGFTVAVTQNTEPASEWRVREFRESVLTSADDGLEELIIFLEKHSKDYPLWKTSESYSFNRKFFINNANDILDTVNIAVTRREFLKNKHIIFDVETRQLTPILGVPFFYELKQSFKNNSLEPNFAFIVDNYIKPLLCYSVVNKEEYKAQIEFYTNSMINFLNANPQKYVLFQQSSYFVPAGEAITGYENTEDSAFFFF